MMAHWSAGVIALFTVLLPFFIEPIRKNRVLLFAFCIAVVVHQLVLILLTYYFTFGVVVSDALFFHQMGSELANTGDFYFGIGAAFYHNFLGVVYRAVGSSRLLGAEMSHLAFTLSLLVLLKIMDMTEVKKYKPATLLIYGLMPSLLLLGASSFREPWQILFFMTSVYWGFKYRKDAKLMSFVFMTLASIAMALFHKALIIFSVMSVSLFYLWPTTSSQPYHYGWQRKITVVLAITGISLAGFWWIAESLGGHFGGEVVNAIMQGRVLDYIDHYHDILRGQAGRASYDVLLNTSSWSALLKSWIIVYFEYLFSPFPWQLENFSDFIGLCEALFRVVLIPLSIYVGVTGFRKKKFEASLLCLCYFAMTLLWSVGTANYGQAMRHHVLTNWIILVLGLPVLLQAAGRYMQSMGWDSAKRRQAL